MSELMILGWGLWLCVSIYLIFLFVGYRSMVQMFPEGKSWWDLPVQLSCIAHFTVVVLLHPFN